MKSCPTRWSGVSAANVRSAQLAWGEGDGAAVGVDVAADPVGVGEPVPDPLGVGVTVDEHAAISRAIASTAVRTPRSRSTSLKTRRSITRVMTSEAALAKVRVSVYSAPTMADIEGGLRCPDRSCSRATFA
jgi:hypothetical protein